MSNLHYQRLLELKKLKEQGVEAPAELPEVADDEKESIVPARVPGSTLNQAVVVELVVFSGFASTLSCFHRTEQHSPAMQSAPEASAWTLPYYVLGEREPLTGVASRMYEGIFGNKPRKSPTLVGIFSEKNYGNTMSILYMALCSFDDIVSIVDPKDRLSWTGASMLTLVINNDLVKAAWNRLKFEVERGPIAAQLLPNQFTLSEMQAITEEVTGNKLDKRNFRKQVIDSDWLEETGEYRRGQHQPAKLYRARAPQNNADSLGEIVLS